MFSPFEELEYLADYLPEEGEVVLLTRESGELVCKPWTRSDLRDGVDDAELYGFLVQANEQMHAVSAFPVWVCILLVSALAIVVHGICGMGWDRWYITPGIALLLFYGCLQWIQRRQRNHFRNQILPRLRGELARRGITNYALMAGVRQHCELRTLLDELIQWSPEQRH